MCIKSVIPVWGGSKSCVVVLCRIESYSVTSSSPRSKCCIAELPFLVSLSSGVSAPRSRVIFHCKVACLSLFDSVPSTTSLPLLSRSFVPKSLPHVELCLVVLGRLRSSATSCSCAGLRALVELLWVFMGNKTCSLK